MLKLSWRNIWRNHRRALITIASVFFAVFFCAVMRCYMDGMWGKMIENSLLTQAGHVEIHEAGYWNDKVIDNFLTMDSATIKQLRKVDNVENISPRIETFALISFGNVSKGVGIIAVSPEQENAKSHLANRIVQGTYLSEYDNAIIIGEGLAKYLKATVGDTVAFIGQGHFGASAAGLFCVRGIVHLAIPDIDNSLVYMTLSAAQNYIDMPDGYSGILISLKDNNKLTEAMNAVAKVVQTADAMPVQKNENEINAGGYEILSWHLTMESLLQTAASDKAFAKIVLFILYFIVGFGILGTVIMLTNERKKEFRIMLSLGMARSKLAAVVGLELFLMSLIGIIAGVTLAFCLSYYFYLNPIKISGDMAKMFLEIGIDPLIPFSIDSNIFITQMIIILFITAIATIYPIRFIKKLKLGN
ncbi:MAG: ABC transporter permease [Paludibacter sp.]|nr:ABC transporter permease [Paludibacter sp.]